MKWNIPWFQNRFGRAGAAYLVLIVSLIPTGAAYYLVEGFVRARDEARFNLAVRGSQELIEKRLAHSVDVLRGLRGLYDAHGSVDRLEWEKYFASIDFKNRYSALQSAGYAARVPAANITQHEARLKSEGYAGYSITGLTNSLELFPIDYLEPMDDAHRSLLGLNLFREPAFREAMTKAAETDNPISTAAVSFSPVAGQTKARDFLIFLPVYQQTRATNAQSRSNALTGFLFVNFNAERMIHDALGKAGPPGLYLEVSDNDGEPGGQLFRTDTGADEGPSRFASTGRISFGGHRWNLKFGSRPVFEEESLSYLPPILLLGGLGFSFALFGIALVQTRARGAAESFTEDLRQAKLRRRLIERATNDAIWDWDIKTGHLAWNEAIQAMFNYSADSIRSDLEWWRVKVHPEDLSRILMGRESALKTGGEFWADEYRFRRGDGSYADVIDRGYIVRDLEGVAIRMIGSMVDITGRKLAEEARRRSEQKLALHVQQTPLAVIEWNLEFEVTEWNPGAQRVFGYTAAEVTGRKGVDLIYPAKAHDEVNKMWDELVRQTTRSREDGVSRGGRIGVSENHTKDGRAIICEWYNTPLIDRNGQVIGVASLALDVTASKLAEQALAAEKERLAVTLRSIGDGVITTDTHGSITLINKVAEGLTGWSYAQAVGQPLGLVFKLVHRKTLEPIDFPINRLLQTGQMVAVSHNCVLSALGGSQRHIDSSGAPIRDKDSHIIGAVLVFRDTTEQQAMADELLRAGKLESLGILAGGIAHDFNNILTAITGNLSLMKMHTNRAEKTYARLEEAEKAAMRARDLTQQLLTFAKGGAPVRKTASINEIVKDSTEFAMRGANVRCEFNLVEDLWPVDVDEGQISQVINNLAINAIQAMPEGGVIHVLTENVVVTAEHGLPLPPGKYVKISIQDHGTGIRPEHLLKIFDPYFTTKQKGSGLGLATSYSIIKRHDGLVTVESELGEGTIFHIYLPASDKPVAERKAEYAGPLHGSGRILVMDDEPLILELAVAALGDLGYEVETVTDGVDAIKLYSERAKEGRGFSAVIMDLTIPGGMGGKETIKRLMAVDPEVKVIVSSGYSNDPVMANFAEFGFKGFVCKPYRVEDLARAVSSILVAQN